MENFVKLPEPILRGKYSLEEILKRRKSVRKFTDKLLTLREISQILWATQGLRDEEGFRTAPSAGALYPLEVYLLSAKVENLEPGLYRYVPRDHKLAFELRGDLRKDLWRAALEQDCILEAPATVIISAIFERTTRKYGDRGIRYVFLDAGHAAQNLYLEATALDLGTVAVGAFYDEEVKRVLHLREKETPIYLMPVGKPER